MNRVQNFDLNYLYFELRFVFPTQMNSGFESQFISPIEFLIISHLRNDSYPHYPSYMRDLLGFIAEGYKSAANQSICFFNDRKNRMNGG